jgi:hypothetical protein
MSSKSYRFKAFGQFSDEDCENLQALSDELKLIYQKTYATEPGKLDAFQEFSIDCSALIYSSVSDLIRKISKE